MALSSQPKEIPKIIHFIWSGGQKIIPPDGIANIKEWMDKNPDHTVFLWVGEHILHYDISSHKKEYLKAFAQYGFTEEDLKRIEFHSPGEILLTIKDSYLRDLYDCIIYETNRLRPNYGASSDLLRYLILSIYGGAYADVCDVKPGNNSLSDLAYEFISTTHYLFLDHLNQQATVSKEQLKTFKIEDQLKNIWIGNDVFLTTKLNPFLKELAKLAAKNYDIKMIASMELRLKEQIKAAYGGNNIKYSTILRTGPAHVRKLLTSFINNSIPKPKGCLHLNIVGEPVVIHPLRYSGDKQSIDQQTFKYEYSGCCPFEHNTTDWLKAGVTKYKGDLNKAIDFAVMAIKFELKHYNIIRLEDHIKDIMESTEINDINLVSATLVSKLREIREKDHLDFGHIEVAQLLSTNEHIISFYAEHNLLDRCYNSLDDQNFAELFCHTIQYESIAPFAGADYCIASEPFNLKELSPAPSRPTYIFTKNRVLRYDGEGMYGYVEIMDDESKITKFAQQLGITESYGPGKLISLTSDQYEIIKTTCQYDDRHIEEITQIFDPDQLRALATNINTGLNFLLLQLNKITQTSHDSHENNPIILRNLADLEQPLKLCEQTTQTISSYLGENLHNLKAWQTVKHEIETLQTTLTSAKSESFRPPTFW